MLHHAPSCAGTAAGNHSARTAQHLQEAGQGGMSIGEWDGGAYMLSGPAQTWLQQSGAVKGAAIPPLSSDSGRWAR